LGRLGKNINFWCVYYRIREKIIYQVDMRENFQKSEEIFNNYLLRLLNLQEDIVRADDFSHPQQKILIDKREHSKSLSIRKKDELIKKIDKNLNKAIWFKKSIHSLEQDNVDDYIEVIRKEDNLKGEEFKRFKLWMKGSTSKKNLIHIISCIVILR